ncbi:MAG: aspartyl/asparaginyl beta-hydroxylase domain-containing protein [Polyangiaceae bacterium]|nr:aspartyl/asparaginyl beta-hydroxylase domain-containing protein [Polyangiaceae bacterium]
MKTGIGDVDRMIQQVLTEAANRFGAAAVERIAASKLAAFEPDTFADARQRPTWVHTPGLRAQPWWTREQCGRLTEMIVAFEESFAKIRSEILNLDTSAATVPYDHLSVDPEAIRGWKNLFFIGDYKPNDDLLAKVPSLKAIVDRFKVEQLDRFELFLSMLEPGTHIPAHFGGGNAKLTLHMPLVIPEGDCALRVDDETRRWKEGEMAIFDDTFDHEAWNRTGQRRAVILLKGYHPDLTVEEIGVLEMFTPLHLQVYRQFLKQKEAARAKA